MASDAGRRGLEEDAGAAEAQGRGALQARRKRLRDRIGRYSSRIALKKVVERLTKPVEELDRQKLEAFCAELGVTSISDITARAQVRVAGEVRSVLIVPRAGAPALEVTVNDGGGAVTAVFLGRRKIAGISPGRRLVLEGMTRADGTRLVAYNPRYQLLA